MARKKKHYECGDIVKVNGDFTAPYYSNYKIIIGSYGDIYGGNDHSSYEVMDIFNDRKGCMTHAWVYIENIEGKVGNISEYTDMFEKKPEKKTRKRTDDAGWQYEFDHADDWKKVHEMGEL